MNRRPIFSALGAAALVALLAMPAHADDQKKDEQSAPAKSGSHVDSHADHGGSQGVNPAVPAAVGTTLGVLGALGAFSPQPAGPPPVQPAAAPPPASDFHYTDRPTWTGPDGRPCRQYEATEATSTGPEPHFGAACLGPDGAWRVVN